ncbi:GNAT family N-acetyltransferase [Desulfobacula sp.]|uniref:GNAT family N-acetyltransferase n=1 Tax=Desulfobacula sp. TaxID=2593537 RepID=UPI0025C0C459|nr:GNAT family N-acetyltransferase [Desulfobacula sp.]MBC2704409.1 GNAT family N-acetyltransferase [Desulfobacula sp.]
MIETIVIKFDEQYAPGIRNIRNAVFTDEQHIDPDMDFDGQDRDAVHVLSICNGNYAGTGRMLKDGHIGRLAVLKDYRGQGLGAKMVLSLVKEAENRGMKRIYLGAQKHAVGFYKKLGFSVYGDPYTEVNIEHIYMEKISLA